MLRSDNRKMYSWWWDSHISPKNSKWLQENLTDMDTKVKQMIKLIEVDEDSFARRAEMYYKRRPELMKFVEEFYRAYRALAERYDHATGVIRQAQRTMAEAFPNQIPSSPADDDSPGSVRTSDPQTPDFLSRVGLPFDPDEPHGDAMGITPSEFHSSKRNSIPAEDLEVAGRKGSKQFSNFLGAEGRVRKGLSFHDVDEKDLSMSDNKRHHLKASGMPESERLGKSDTDIQALKEALTKLEAEKLAGLLEYQQSLERLSNLESEVSRAQEDSRGYSERASKAEAEASRLKEALATVEAEREASLLQYQECLDRVSNLEATVSHVQEDAGELSNRVLSAEKQAEDMRTELALLKDEKEADLAKYMLALEKIANLENKLLLAEQDASMASERAEKAEKEVEALKEAIARLTEDKEALALQQQLYLEKIAYMEHEILQSQGEAKRLRREIDAGVAKLKGAEEQYLLLETSNKSMQVELNTLSLKVGAQSEELSEKQEEVGRLWTNVQEERLRFSEAEAAFQSLQSLHSRAQEEIRSAAAELQKQIQLLKEMEILNEQLSSEVESIKGENKSLNEVNLSAAVLIKNMQEDISNLREGKEKLEEELELRLDQGNALQHEIYSLKEEIKELSKRHGAVLDQVVSVGLKPECFGSTVRELQEENLKLKESCQKNEIEITALLEKLGVMENLIEKNASLESSLLSLSTELEEAREKVKALEESFKSLIGEKSTILHEKSSLISQLAMTAENLEKVSESNTHLENSLSDANAELEALRLKSKNLEDSCRLLTDEKSVLVSERQTLSLQLETSHRSLEEIGKWQIELENSLSNANAELEALRMKSNNLEDSCRLLTDEKSVLVAERQTLTLQLETSHRSLEEIGKWQVELENSLSNTNAELEALRLRSKNLEDSCRLLTDEKSVLVAERQTLSLQLETSHRSLEEIGKWQVELENSLSNANAELEALRLKSKNLEDSCRLLTDEKSVLVAERQTLTLQLETSHRSLEKIGKQQSELEQKYLLLEEEREAALRIVEELRASLDAEMQERANSDQLSLLQMADMENKIHSLQESGLKTKEELDAELDKAVNAQLEIYILRKYVQDLKDNNSSLLIKYEKFLEAYQFSEKLISELEREKHDQQLEVQLLSDQIKRLRIGMSQFCQALEVDAGLECEDVVYRDQMILLNIIRKLDDKKRSLSKAVEEHEKLVVEKSILVALLGQLKDELADWKAVVNSLSHEFKVGNEKISFLQKDMQKLLESNEELILRVREGNQREELYAAEIEYLRGRLLDMQSAHQNLERENHMILEEKCTLHNEIANLEQEKHKLESENSHLIVEGVALDSLTVTFRNIILEKSGDIEELAESIQQLYNENNALQAKVRSMEGSLEQIHEEKTSLLVSLHSSKNELEEVISTKGQLEAEIKNTKHILSKMERERLDIEAMIDNQGKQLHELSEKYNLQVKDSELLKESIQILDAQISRMSKQHREAEEALETLGMEVWKTKDEAERWETIAGTLFGELQSSSVRELLLNEKLFELNDAYKILEDVHHFKVVEITELSERVGNLEGENGEMKAEVEAFLPVISSLRDCVASLENHTTLGTPIGIEEEKDAESWQKGISDKVSSESAKIAELKVVETRIRGIEKALVAMKRLAEEESSNYSLKLESTMKQLEAMKAGSNSRLGSIRSSQHLPSHEELGYGTDQGWRQRKLGSDAYEAEVNELQMKDITLDSTSEASFYGKHRTDDDILEVWEAIGKTGSMDRTTVGKSRGAEVVSPKKYSNFDSKNRHPSTKSLVEKEMYVDQHDISKRSSDYPQEENKKKVLERLDSDRLRLNNLQITVQELKKKVQVLGNSGTEYDRAKEQLVEAEKTIQKLLDINSRLLKNVELSSSSYDSLSTVESSEGGGGGGRGSARRRKACERARKCSEKIGKLDLDLQKIKFILLKHDDGDKKKKGSKGGSRLVEWDTRVILRDYLYGGLKSPRRRKKAPRFFCGWARPPTRGD